MREIEYTGYKAFNNGNKLGDNPCKDNTEEHAGWTEGWKYAENKAKGVQDYN